MNLEQIRRIIGALDLGQGAEVLLNPSVEDGVLITLYVSRDPNGRRHPSGEVLARIKREVGRVGASVEFLLLDKEQHEIEDGLRASLVSSYPKLIRNSYTTVIEGVAQVWIEKKRELTDSEREAVTNHVRKYADLFNLRGAVLNVTSDFSLATPTEVLRAIRKLSPTTCEAVCHELESRGFSVPSLQWVNHKLDLLRKNGLVVRMPDRSYALTWLALHQLGTQKNKRSPDIGRLLALARRGK
jgi:hypothetical protein